MSFYRKFLFYILNIIQKVLVKTNVIPSLTLEDLGVSKDNNNVFVLKNASIFDFLALNNACVALGFKDLLDFKSIDQGQPLDDGSPLCRVIFINRQSIFFNFKNHINAASEDLNVLFDFKRNNPDYELHVIPISIFWGRKPEQESISFFTKILEANSFRYIVKFFQVLVFGRRNFVNFSKPIVVSSYFLSNSQDSQIAQKVVRVCRVHFYRLKRAIRGPSLPVRSLFIRRVMESSAVKDLIEKEVSAKNQSPAKVRKKAYAILDEIAANYVDSAIMMANHILGFIYNRIYKGVNVIGIDKVREAAEKDHEIVYVPCHRSHMDYLILSYVLYKEGVLPPHIAAGNNLNIFMVGSILRRGGAFFIRRSFNGNKFYSTIFKSYIDEVIKQGHSIEFFIEGGRSRSGKCLYPKTGVLSIIVQSFLRTSKKSLSIVPIYLSYDNVIEANGYRSDLNSGKKKKESILQIFKTLLNLKKYGKCYLSFGDPINLGKELDKADLLNDFCVKSNRFISFNNELANKIMRGINGCAVINLVSLSSLIVLSSKNNVIEKDIFEEQLSLFKNIVSSNKFNSNIILFNESAEDVIADLLSLGKFYLVKDIFGSLLKINPQVVYELQYYKNNILHLYLLPSFIVCYLRNNEAVSRDELLSFCECILPFLEKEFFIDVANVDEYLAESIRVLIDNNILVEKNTTLFVDDSNSNCSLLQLVSETTIFRYSLIFNFFSFDISKKDFLDKALCASKRISILLDVDDPDFFNKSLYGVLFDFINTHIATDKNKFNKLKGYIDSITDRDLKFLLTKHKY